MCVLATIATLSLIFMGTSGTSIGTLVFHYDTIRRRIGDVVPDAERKDRALATLDSMEQSAKTHIGSVFDSLDQVSQEMQVYSADLEQIEREKILPLDQKRTAFMMEILDYRFELKESLLEEEWNQVFAPVA